jgi:hypothetical protein
MSKEITYNIHSLPAALMLQHRLDDNHIQTLNNYLDNLLISETKKSAASDLVGQIHQGEQLIMDYNHDDLKKIVLLIENLGATYLKHFVEQTGYTKMRPKKIEMDKLWSVHSYAGDYNPIHDHLTKSHMGISFTCWTKVPEQIGNADQENKRMYNLYNESGAIDGFINFTYGLNQTADPERLRPSQSRYVKPEKGVLLMFPSWMQHTVYPFRGEGERRTVAGNLNCFDMTLDDIKKIKEQNEI